MLIKPIWNKIIKYINFTNSDSFVFFQTGAFPIQKKQGKVIFFSTSQEWKKYENLDVVNYFQNQTPTQIALNSNSVLVIFSYDPEFKNIHILRNLTTLSDHIIKQLFNDNNEELIDEILDKIEVKSLLRLGNTDGNSFLTASMVQEAFKTVNASASFLSLSPEKKRATIRTLNIHLNKTRKNDE
jgi:hypothetical protein